MKRNNRYKSTYNAALKLIGELPLASGLPTEAALSKQLIASRTTIRSVLTQLASERIIEWRGRTKLVLRRPIVDDYYVFAETQSTNQLIEAAFMQWILSGDIGEGATFKESELADEFGVSISALREFLNRFSRFGLIEKQTNRGWLLRGFTKAFALELSDVREMFELRSIEHFLEQPESDACWKELIDLEVTHLALADEVDMDNLTFSQLDERFHRCINAAANNRFITDFHDLISMIFHYHYRWSKHDERERNAVALAQHLAIIEALKKRDARGARNACHAHLASARETLLNSISWQ